MIALYSYDTRLAASGESFSTLSCHSKGKTSVDKSSRCPSLRRPAWAIRCGIALKSVHFAASFGNALLLGVPNHA